MDMIIFPNITLVNVRAREMICNCEAHCGDLIQQIDAQLPNGKPVVILKDWWGLHVAIGARNCIGEWQYTEPVTMQEAERMLREAMRCP